MKQLHTGALSHGISPAGARSELAEWSAFLVRHTQRLEQCHNVLFGLCWLEGPPSMRRRCEERLAAGKRALPWIRAVSQWAPPEEEETLERIEVLASLGFSTVAACALAPAVGVGFVVSRLGSIGRVDLRRGRSLEPDVTIRRDRPLQLACSEDGRYLAIAFETGGIDVLEVQPEVEGAQRERLVWSALCRVPDYEAPTLEFLDAELWRQTETGDAVACHVATGAERRRVAPPGDLTGPELAAATRVQDASILVWRGHGGSRLVCVPDSGREQSTLAEAADVIAIRRWDADAVAVSFSDRRLCIYAVGPALQLRHQLLLDVPAARLAACGSRLWWISTYGRMYLWTPGVEAAQPVWTAGLTFEGVRGLALAPNENGLVLAPNLGVAFRAGGRATRGVRFQAAAPRPGGYVALAVTRESYVVIDGVGRETLPVIPSQPLSADMSGDGREVGYLFAVDGDGRILVHDGKAELLDLSTRDRLACGLPDGTISATGRRTGGFWLADVQGRIFSLDRAGVCREAAVASRNVIGPPRLAAWGSLVVWTATRVATAGLDVVYLQVFFRAVNDRLDRIGEREYAAADGILQTVSWDEARGRLIGIWEGSVHGSTVAKIGNPEALIAGSEDERLLPGIYGSCQAAAMSQDSRRLFVLSADGAIRCFDADTFAPVAALAGSVPFTGLSEGVPAQDEVVVIAGRQRVLRLHCEEGGNA